MRLTDDIILSELYKNPDRDLAPFYILDTQGYSVDPIELRRIIIELKSKGLVEDGELWGKEYNIRLTSKAVELLNTFGSYENFLNTQTKNKRHAESKARGGRRWRNFFEISTVLLGLATAILTVLSYLDNKELEKKEVQIKLLEKTVELQKARLDSISAIAPNVK